MSPFGIFTVILVVLYLLYYGVQISRDLYCKKGKSKSEEEEFDVSMLEDEEFAVGVQESSDGFLIDSSRKTAAASPTFGLNCEAPTTKKTAPPSGFGSGAGSKDGIASVGEAESSSDADAGFNPGEDSATRAVIEKVQNELEVIEPQGSATVSKEFFKELLLAADKKGSLFLDAYQVTTV